jgi:preprotein translocase subunit SecF
MKKSFSKKILLAYILIFIAGGFAGQAIAVWGIKSVSMNQVNGKKYKKHNSAKMEKKLADKLELNMKQEEKLKTLLGNMRVKIREENSETRKKIKDIINDTFNEIETILDEQQKIKFRRIKKRLPILKKKCRPFRGHFRQNRHDIQNCRD